MNYISATVSSIIKNEQLSLIDFTVNSSKLTMVSLSLEETILKDSEVILGVKNSMISLATQETEKISLSNQLTCKILSIEYGEILSLLKLSFETDILESIITTRSLKRLNLKKDGQVIALIKASDLFIVKLIK